MFYIHPIKYWFLFPFTMSERIKIGSLKKVPTEQNSALVRLFSILDRLFLQRGTLEFLKFIRFIIFYNNFL